MGLSRAWDTVREPPWQFLMSRWPWLALLYLVVSALLAVLLLPVLAIAFLLLPMWALAVGALERRRTQMAGFPRQLSGHVTVAENERHHWINIRLTEPATWREAIALLVDLVFGAAVVVILFFEGVIVLALGMLVYAGVTGPNEVQFIGEADGVMTPSNWWPVALIGGVMLCLLAYVNVLVAVAQAHVLRVLCGPRQREIDQNIERLLQSRRALAESFEAERRRIERDLHDGVQQELIALSAKLGMIGLEIEDLAAQGADTSATTRAVNAAREQAEHAMTTLRATVRGIHPSVLTDHGLDAALEELAERSPVSVLLDLEPAEHMPATVETAAYYFTVEALNNIAKHTTATTAHVRKDIHQHAVTITVTDDGEGGADENTGTGLRGLRERIEILGGEFLLNSPAGGPTTVQMTVPVTRSEESGHANPHR